MGRVLLPPYGDVTSNISGVHKKIFSAADSAEFASGAFLQFVKRNSDIQVIPSNNRFNIGMISITDNVGGGSFYTEGMIPEKESTDYINTINEATAVVSEKYVSAGEFITIQADSTIKRATDFESINGYAVDSGKFGATIRIRTNAN